MGCTFQLQSRKSSTHISLITDEHKDLIQAYQKEPILKHGMNAYTENQDSLIDGVCLELVSQFD